MMNNRPTPNRLGRGELAPRANVDAASWLTATS